MLCCGEIDVGQDKYVEFLPGAAARARALSGEAAGLRGGATAEVAALRRALEAAAPPAPAAKGARLRAQLEDVEEALDSLAGLAGLAEGLEGLLLLAPAVEPLEFARVLLPLEAALKELPADDDGFISNLRYELVCHREGLLYALLQWWKDSFKVSSPPDFPPAVFLLVMRWCR